MRRGKRERIRGRKSLYPFDVITAFVRTIQKGYLLVIRNASIQPAGLYKYANFQRVAVSQNNITQPPPPKFDQDFSATIAANLAHNLVFCLVNSGKKKKERKSNPVQIDAIRGIMVFLTFFSFSFSFFSQLVSSLISFEIFSMIKHNFLLKIKKSSLNFLI